MKRMLAVAILTMAASSLALGQMTGKKANYANQKGDSVEQAVMQMEEALRVAIMKGDTLVWISVTMLGNPRVTHCNPTRCRRPAKRESDRRLSMSGS